MVPSSPQEIAVLVPLMLALVTTPITLVIHDGALNETVQFIRSEHRFGRVGIGSWTDVAIVVGIALFALIAHLVEIAIWAVLYDACGEFKELGPAFYHSAMNYTSLGYGDIVMSASSKSSGPLEAAPASVTTRAVDSNHRPPDPQSASSY
jgi:hypothetical protein